MNDEIKKIIGYVIMALGAIIGIITTITSEGNIMMMIIYTFLGLIIGYLFILSTEEEQTRINIEQIKKSVGKCPHCGSYKTYKISTTSRVVSTTALGLASDKIGKQYACHDCQHKW